MCFGLVLHSRYGGRFFHIFPAILIICFLLFPCGAAADSDSTEHLEVAMVYSVGDRITLGGTTNLASGTVLLISVEEASFGPDEKGGVEIVSGTSGTVVVQEGLPADWSFSFSTDGWAPGAYLARIEALNTGTSVSVTFALVPAEENLGEPAPSVSPLLSPPDTPVSSPLPPVSPPTTVSLSPVVVAAACAAVGLFRSYFS